MPNILDKRFKYTPAAATDLKATFARIRREQRAQAEREKAAQSERETKVRKIAKS